MIALIDEKENLVILYSIYKKIRKFNTPFNDSIMYMRLLIASVVKNWIIQLNKYCMYVSKLVTKQTSVRLISLIPGIPRQNKI